MLKRRDLRLFLGKFRSFPFYVYILTIVVVTMSVVGTGLALYVYGTIKQSGVVRAERNAQHEASDIADSVERLFAAAESTVEILAADPIGKHKTLEERWQRVDSLKKLADISPFLNSIFFGYEDGSYLLLRHLDPISRGKMHSPLDAEYNVQSIATVAGGRQEFKTFYLDKNLATIQTLIRTENTYDPREKEWYIQGAKSVDGVVRVGPFSSTTTREWALAFARKSSVGPMVDTTMISFNSLTSALTNRRPTPNSELALVNAKGELFAYHDWHQLIIAAADKAGETRPVNIKELSNRVLAGVLSAQPSSTFLETRYVADANGGRWFSVTVPVRAGGGAPMWLVVATPVEELFGAAPQARNSIIAATLLSILLASAICYLLVKRTARRLEVAAQYALDISRFDFSSKLAVTSHITEIAHFTRTLLVLKDSVRRFVDVTRHLGSEKDLPELLQLVLKETMKILDGAAGVVYLRSADGKSYHPHACLPALAEVSAIPLRAMSSLLSTGEFNPEPQMLLLSAPYELNGADLGFIAQIASGSSARVVLFPLSDERKKLLGVIALVVKSEAHPSKGKLAFINAFCGAAAIAMGHHRLVAQQRDMILSLAGALATHPAQAGRAGQAEKLFELALALAEQADQSEDGVFREYALSDAGRDVLYVSSCLHGAGKTMPLDALVFPEYLQEVPLIAGLPAASKVETKVENKPDRRQSGSQPGDKRSHEARFFALAEALVRMTAPDQADGVAGTLSAALASMRELVGEEPADAEVFNLLISSGVFLSYAEKHLSAAQIDLTLAQAGSRFLLVSGQHKKL